MEQLFLKQYETRTFEAELSETAAALAGATIRFTIVSPSGKRTEKTATLVEGATTGLVRVKLTAVDTAELGDHRGEWSVTQAGETRVIPSQGFWGLYVRGSLLAAPAL